MNEARTPWYYWLAAYLLLIGLGILAIWYFRVLRPWASGLGRRYLPGWSGIIILGLLMLLIIVLEPTLLSVAFR
jgi:hypothetical protein